MPEEENRTLSDKFMLRLPDGMRDQIKTSANNNGRSMNAEIVQAIIYYLQRPRFEIDVGLQPVQDYDFTEENADAAMEPRAHFVDGPDDIARAVDQMAERYKQTLRESLFELMNRNPPKE